MASTRLSKDILDAIVQQGGRLDDPLSLHPASSLSPPLAPLFKLAFGATRLLWFVQRPFWVPFAVILYLRRWRNIWAQSKVLSFFVVGVLSKALYSLCHDPIFVRALQRLVPPKPSPDKVTPGIFWNQRSERMKSILSRCSFAQGTPYRAPSLLWNGDLTTIYYAIFCSAPDIQFQRTFIPVGSEHFVLDWAFPREVNRQTTPVMLLIPGVGGDSKVPYLLQACKKVLEQGWVCCVLLARGLGSTRVKNVRYLFDPSALDDVQASVNLIGGVFGGPIFMAGFSLGGVTVCNYLSRSSSSASSVSASSSPSSSCSPSARVVAAVAVSGAFRLDTMNWWRYRSVYQPVIVPALLLGLHHKYGDQFEGLLPSVSHKALFSATCYADLHLHLFSHIKQATQRKLIEEFAAVTTPSEPEKKFDLTNPMRSMPVEFEVWKNSMEGHDHRHNIQVPLLLFTALDDPFHNADTIGIETSPANENIVYYVTETGGHVAWPVGVRDFSFAQSVIVDFCRSVQHELL